MGERTQAQHSSPQSVRKPFNSYQFVHIQTLRPSSHDLKLKPCRCVISHSVRDASCPAKANQGRRYQVLCADVERRQRGSYRPSRCRLANATLPLPCSCLRAHFPPSCLSSKLLRFAGLSPIISSVPAADRRTHDMKKGDSMEENKNKAKSQAICS